MPYTNERVIFTSDKNGFVVKKQSLKNIKEGLKGTTITIKQLKDGEVSTGNLYYVWVTEQAEGLFHFICRCLRTNKDKFTNKHWDFMHHQIHFLIKHRN